MKKQKLSVVKIGGKLIENENLLQTFLRSFVDLQGHKILIHGGGILATQLSDQLGYKSTLIDGRRITDENTMKVITMTYAGYINKNIVAKLIGSGCNAIGLCGADGSSILSKRRAVKDIDYGNVGDVETVNTEFICSLLTQQITPVFSAISCTKEGQLLNTNADSIAAEVAIALSKDFETHLFYSLNKNGVLMDAENDKSVIEELDFVLYQDLQAKGLISNGMLPKLHNCFHALQHNVNNVYVGGVDVLKSGIKQTKILN
jgi:acetylglutamate kinase